MAARQPPRGEDNAAQRTVPLDCFHSVFRACRQEAAGGRQQGRYEQLIAAHRGAQRHPRYPRTMLPFHLITPRAARRISRGGIGSPGQPNMRDCDQVLPTLRLRVNPAHRAAPKTGHAAINEPRCLCGHDNERKSERTCGLTTPLSEEIKTGRARRSHCLAFGGSKVPTDQILISSEPKVALASGVVPLFSTRSPAP
jgi:hypothetical protein